MLAIGYLLGFVAFLWERWTGRQGGRYKAATTKSDRGLKRQKVQETGGFKSLEVETIEPTTPKVEQNVSKVLQVVPNVPLDIATNGQNASDNPPPFYETKEAEMYFCPINNVWMDQLKKDKNTKWNEVKTRFQIPEPDFSPRRKGTLIKEKTVYPTEKQIQNKMAQLSSGQRSLLENLEPSNKEFQESLNRSIEKSDSDDSTILKTEKF